VKLFQKEVSKDIRWKLKIHEEFLNTSRCDSGLGKTSLSPLLKLRPVMACDVLRTGGRLQLNPP